MCEIPTIFYFKNLTENLDVFQVVVAAEPAASLSGTQQAASSAAQSAAQSFASASSSVISR